MTRTTIFAIVVLCLLIGFALGVAASGTTAQAGDFDRTRVYQWWTFEPRPTFEYQGPDIPVCDPACEHWCVTPTPGDTNGH